MTHPKISTNRMSPPLHRYDAHDSRENRWFARYERLQDERRSRRPTMRPCTSKDGYLPDNFCPLNQKVVRWQKADSSGGYRTLTPSPTSFSAWTPARSSFRRRFSARFLRNRCPDRRQNPDSPRLPQPKAVVPSFLPRKPSTKAVLSPKSPLPQSQLSDRIGSPRFFQYFNV